MPYQNNNNRLTPQQTKDIRLNPQATPLNKKLEYQFNADKYKGWNDIANGLIRFGQGLVDIDPVLQVQADKAITVAKQQLDENQKEWADYSRKVQWAAKFNPYLKDAYQRSIASDQAQAAFLKLASKEDLDKMAPDEFEQFKNNTTQEMFDILDTTDIRPKNFEKALLNYDQQVKNLEANYIIKHAEYIDKKYAIAKANDISDALGTASLAEDKNTAMIEALDMQMTELRDLGKSDEYQLSVLKDGLTVFLKDNSEALNSADLTALTGTLKINNKSLKEIDPNISYDMLQILRQAKRADLADRQFEYDCNNLKFKLNEQQANREFSLYAKDNPEIWDSPEDMIEKFKELVEKYDLYNDPNNLMGEIVQHKNYLTKLLQQDTDEGTAQELAIKLAAGELTSDDVVEAMRSGKLKYREGFNFIDRMTREEKAETAEIDKRVQGHMKSIYDEYFKKGGAYYVEDNDLRQQAQQEASNYQGMFAVGKMTYQEFNDNLADLKFGLRKKQTDEEQANELSAIINDAQINITNDITKRYNSGKVTNAFKKMGMVRSRTNSNRTSKDIYVASPVSTNRNGRAHKGTDWGGSDVYIGAPLHMPRNGQVVYSGNNGTAGNMVVIKYDNGKYSKTMHMNAKGMPKVGQSFNKGDVFGYVGDTGQVENKGVGCLHNMFFDRNRKPIPDNEF